MNSKRTFLLLLFLSLTVVSCKCHEKSQAADKAITQEVKNTQTAVDSLLAGISRGACFGACPQYKATVYKSGFALYEGERNVKKTGTWSATLSKEQLNELLGFLRVYKMEEKDSAYINKYLADYPAYYLWICDRKPRREILINHEAPPVEIIEYTKLFEKLLDQLQWKPLPGKARHDEE